MSLLYTKHQQGGKFPEDISTVRNSNALDDTDRYFESYDNSASEEVYKMFFKYKDDFRQPSDPNEKSQPNPVVNKVGEDTTTNNIPFKTNLRSNLPFENEFEWMQYKDFLHEKELSGRSDIKSLKHFNSGGYVGAYQLGTMALQEADMLKDTLVGTTQKNKIMNSNNWKGGSKSRDAFLSDIRIQEDALKRYTAKNFKYIKSSLIANNVMDKSNIMGYLAGTHLAGQKNVKAYLKNNGSTFKDGNGTTIDVYRNGYNAWIKDQYVDGQGKRRFFDKKNAVEMLKKKGILVEHRDYFPEDYRIPGNKTLPWQE